MTKLERLNSFLSERLTAALKEIIYTVSVTMKEYEEETARIRKENHHLKEMLKVTACSVTEANPDVTVFSLPGGQEDCNSSLEQKSETQESQNEHWQKKEENSCIKTEQASYHAVAGFQPETRQTYVTQPDYTVEPIQCSAHLNSQAVDQEMIDYEFPAKIKVESGNAPSADTTDSADASTQSWSPQNWDVLSEKSDRARVQQVSMQPCTAEGAHSAESAFQNRPVEFRATQPDCTVVPLQCTSPLNAQAVDQEMMHYELTEIKAESVDSDSYSETTDDMDRTESTDSMHSTEQWDRIFSEKSNQSRVHQASSRWPRAVKGARFKESASQKNRPMEFRPVFSISNQILCNNKQHCTSRQCEMHKTIPKSSPVWRYFSLKEGDCSKAVCLICKAVISRGIKEYTTSALLRHLRGKHGKC
ncbi:hypothetical protein MHYP_G00153440 [Metynnis hypsauchen]